MIDLHLQMHNLEVKMGSVDRVIALGYWPGTLREKLQSPGHRNHVYQKQEAEFRQKLRNI